MSIGSKNKGDFDMKQKISMAVIIIFIVLISNYSVDSRETVGSDLIPSRGNGTISDPFKISNVWDLQNISKNLSAHYVLENNINASITKNWNAASGFDPIGYFSYHPYYLVPFTGSIDGRNHTIEGLYIKRDSTDNVGLFGLVDSNTNIKNLGLLNVTIVGKENVGGLIGYLKQGYINNCYSTGNISGYGGLGGLIGYIYDGNVSNSYSTVMISGGGSVGGFAGVNYGTIYKCYSTGDAFGEGRLGGFVGFNKASITSCYSTGKVIGTLYRIGGFIGENAGSIIGSHSIGIVSGKIGMGGFVGLNIGTINLSYTSSNVVGETSVGGFSGHSSGSVSYCYSTGNVNGDEYIGGFMPSNTGSVYHSYSTGRVSGKSEVGGFINSISSGGTVTSSFWDINTSGMKYSNGGIGKTTKEMKIMITYTDYKWDFKNVWCISETKTYPLLRYQDTLPPSAKAGQDFITEAGFPTMLNGSESTDDIGIANYTWTFVDNIAITLYGVNPTYIFSQISTYFVTLHVVDVVNNVHNTTLNITTIDTTKPISNAGINVTIDEDEIFGFDGSKSTDNVEILNYTWTFNDKMKDVVLYGIKPSYQFNIPGIIIVDLKVTDIVGLWDTDTIKIKVNDIHNPVADAGQDVVISEGEMVTFDGSGSKDDGGISRYSWTFHDGKRNIQYEGINPSHQFTVPGKYVVNLRVYDNSKRWDTDTVNVTVNDITIPVAHAGYNYTINEGETFTFIGTGSNDNVGIAKWEWSFIDKIKIIMYDTKPTYKFNNPGVYLITLKVTDAAGNWNTDTMILTVKDITTPIAVASPNQIVNEGTSVLLNGKESTDNVRIVNYTWMFKDQIKYIILFGINISYIFHQPGIYIVTLIVKDADGNTDENQTVITVIDITRPVSNAGLDIEIDENNQVIFDGRNSYDNVKIMSYIWSFFDGIENITLYGHESMYIFKNPGVYRVNLTVMDSAGLTDSDIVIVVVKDITNPIANAGQDLVIKAGSIFYLNGSGSRDNVGIINYTWMIKIASGDQILYGINVSYIILDPGIYNVDLIVKDSADNMDYDKIKINVIEESKNNKSKNVIWILFTMITIIVIILVCVFVYIIYKKKSTDKTINNGNNVMNL